MNFDRMLAYTEALSRNNDRTWFHDNHKQYEEAREDFLMLLDIMKFVVAQEAPSIGESLIFENPKIFMYRIPRDMRYSRGKEPYNPSFRAYFSPHKKNFLPLSYYLHISHERCFIEGGAWPWEPKDLTRLREHIMYNYEELDDIVRENGIVMQGKSLKRVPRSYDPGHPASEWMKYKYYTAEQDFSPEDMASFESFTEAAAGAIRRFEPLRLYLSAAFSAEPLDEEY